VGILAALVSVVLGAVSLVRKETNKGLAITANPPGILAGLELAMVMFFLFVTAFSAI
jgi:hypothetical protein